MTDDAALVRATAVDGYDADVERAIVFDVGGWTANCPQHIPRRFSEATMLRNPRRCACASRSLKRRMRGFAADSLAA